MNSEPSYLGLHRSGELKKRGELLWSSLESCKLCPRNCKVNRIEGERGTCKASAVLEIASLNPHFGEEAPLSGFHGSGTIFFSHCNLRCIFCINGDISIGGAGNSYGIDELASMMLHLQGRGCHNINVVTPTHYAPHIVMALDKAASRGLSVPFVYNTSTYEHLEVLKLLDGIVDIYLADFKYLNSETADKYSAGARDYPEAAKRAFIEMQQQVGTAMVGDRGIMKRGLMIRHLVMPGNVSSSEEVLTWISKNLPLDTYINLMSQYRPYHEAWKYPELDRPLNRKEYYDLVQLAQNLGLCNMEVQGI